MHNVVFIVRSNAPLLTHDIETQHVHDTALSHVEAKLDIDPTYATVKYKRAKLILFLPI